MTQAAVQTLPYEIVCSSDDRDLWLKARKQGLGASEISMVLGEAPTSWGDALSLYATKIGKYERNLDSIEAVFWGRHLESKIIEAYEERTGRRTRKERHLLRSVAHPWCLATLDGSTTDTVAANDNSNWWPLEVKNTNQFMLEDWEFGAPVYYYLQVQQQLLVTGQQKGTIAALIGGQRMVWQDIPRDETTIRKIIYHGERFWQRVLARDVPPPTGSEASKKALAALYPQGEGIVLLPAVAGEWADQIEKLKADIKKANEQVDLIENTVIAALCAANAELGVLPDRRSFSRKFQTRRSYTVKETSFPVLRMHKAPK